MSWEDTLAGRRVRRGRNSAVIFSLTIISFTTGGRVCVCLRVRERGGLTGYCPEEAVVGVCLVHTPPQVLTGVLTTDAAYPEPAQHIVHIHTHHRHTP